MKNFQALAIGVIAGLVVSNICCEKSPKPCPKPQPCEDRCKPCEQQQKIACKKCYYKRYYR